MFYFVKNMEIIFLQKLVLKDKWNVLILQEAELAALEAAEREQELLEEKKRREAEGIFDDDDVLLLNNNNNNININIISGGNEKIENQIMPGYHDGFYDDVHQGQHQLELMDRPPMRLVVTLTQ